MVGFVRRVRAGLVGSLDSHIRRRAKSPEAEGGPHIQRTPRVIGDDASISERAGSRQASAESGIRNEMCPRAFQWHFVATDSSIDP